MSTTLSFDRTLFNALRPMPRVIEIDTSLLPDPWADFCDKQRIRLYAVIGYENPAKQIKIWPACNVLWRGIERGEHLRTDTANDSTSGNYGLGFMLALREVRKHYLDFPLRHFVSVVPRTTPRGKLDMLEAAGIRIEFGEDSFDAMQRAEALALQHGWWYTRQYWNPDNTEAYGPFGAHVANNLPELAVFACGIGSGGTCSGVVPALRQGLGTRGARLRAVAVVVEAGSAVAGVRTEKALEPGTLQWRQVVNDRRYIRLEDALVFSAALWRTPTSTAFDSCYGGESAGFNCLGGLLSTQAAGPANLPRAKDGSLHVTFVAPDMRDPYRENFAKHGIFF